MAQDDVGQTTDSLREKTGVRRSPCVVTAGDFTTMRWRTCTSESLGSNPNANRATYTERTGHHAQPQGSVAWQRVHHR